MALWFICLCSNCIIIISAVFVAADDETMGILGYLVTLLLAAIAFQFVISSSISKVPYLTLLDKYVICCFSFLFGIMVQVSIIKVINLASNNKITIGTMYLYAFILN